MQDLDDLALLREYAANDSGTAFEELVSRRVGFVYSSALRQARNPLNRQVLIESRKWYDLPKNLSLVNGSGTLIFDASGKLRPMTMKDMREIQKPAKTNQ